MHRFRASSLALLAAMSALPPALAQTTLFFNPGENYGTDNDTTGNPLTVNIVSGLAAHNGNISGTGTLTKTGAGTIVLTGNNSYTGGTTLLDGVLQFGTGGSGGAIVGDVANSGTLVFKLGTDHTYAGVVSGGGGLVHEGFILRLANAQTYTGPTTVRSGAYLVLSTSVDQGLSASTTVELEAGSFLDFSNRALTLAGLSGAGTVYSFIPGGGSAAGHLTLNVAAGEAFTFSGNLGHTLPEFGLTKTGAGTQVLSGASTYTGATTVTGGTLSINADAALGAAPASPTPGHLTLDGGTLATTDSFTLHAHRGLALGAAGGTLDTAAATTLGYAGVIEGSGGLAKTGAGTLTLSGTNTFTGSTTVTGGTLSINADAALGAAPASPTPGHLTLDGGTLATTATFELAANRGVALSSFGGTFNTAEATTLTYDGILAGGGHLTKTGAGTLALTGANSHSGNTSITAGTLILDPGQAITAGNFELFGAPADKATLTVTGDGTALSAGHIWLGTQADTNGTLNVTGGASVSLATTLSLADTGTSTAAATISGAGSTLAVGNNVYLGFAGAGTLTVADGGTLVVNTNQGQSGGEYFRLSLGSSNGATGTFNLNAGGTLRVGGTDGIATGYPGIGVGSGTFNANGGTIQVINADLTTSVPLTLGDATSSTVNTNGFNATLSGTISGSGALSKVGTGTLTLSGANTYTGSTTINAGTLTLASDSALGSTTTGTTVATVATLALTGGINVAEAIANSGTVTNTSGTNTLSGNLSGSGALTVTGGTLTLSGANTYTGATTINAGTLRLGSANALGATASVDVSSGAILDLNDFSVTLADLDGDGAIALGSATLTTGDADNHVLGGELSGTDGGLTKVGAGNLTLTAANTHTGATTVSAGTLTLAHADALGSTATGTTVASGATLALTGGINVAEAIANSGTVTNTSGTNTLSGNLSGSGALTVTGGTLTLAGTNTYAGSTTVSAGTLRLGSANALGATASVTTSAGATLDLNDHSVTIGGLNAAGNIDLGSATLTTGDAAHHSLSGNLSGTGSLVKIGTGTLTLSGTNTYTGNTTLSTGTLVFDTPGALYSGVTTDWSKLHVASGTTLAVNVTPTGFDHSALSSVLNHVSFASTPPALELQLPDNYSLNQNLDLDLTSTITPSSTLTLSGATPIHLLNGHTLTLGVAANQTLTVDRPFAGGFPNTFFNRDSGNLALVGGTVTFLSNVDLSGGDHVPPITARGGHGGAITVSAGNVLFAQALDLSGGQGTNAYIDGVGGAVYGADGGNGGSLNVTGGTVTLGSSSSLKLAGGNGGNGGPFGNITPGNPGAPGTLTLSGGSLELPSLGWLGNSATFVGNIAFTGGTLRSVDAAENVTFDGASALGQAFANADVTAARTLDLPGQLTLSGSIAGSGNLTKAGSGTLTLAAANTHTGETLVSAGTLVLGHAQALQNSTPVLTGGTLDFGTLTSATFGRLSGSSDFALVNTDAVPTAVALSVGNNNTDTTHSGVLSGPGSLIKLGTGTLTLTGANTYAGATTIDGGTLSIAADTALGTAPNSATADHLTFDGGSLATTATFTLDARRGLTIGASGGTFDTADATTLATGGIIAGSGDFTKTGTGSLTLSGANTYTGATTVSAGTLTLANDVALGTNAAGTTVDSGATLALTGDIAVAEAIANNGTLTSTSGTNTLSGILSGTGNLAVTGGSLTLSGANSFTGSTTIANGTLTIGADNALGTAPASATPGHLTLDGGTLTTTANFTLHSNRGLALGSSGGTLAADSGTTLTYGGIIAGDGTLTTSGSGTVVLSGTNTHTGGTTVTGGTLQVTNVAPLGSGNLTVTDGTLSIAQNTAFDRSVTVSGATAHLTTPGYFEVASAADSTGSLTLSDGGIITAGTSFAAGVNAGSHGTLNLTGANSILNVGTTFFLGYLGTGTLNLSDGATVNTDALFLGGINTGNGTFNLNDGGTLAMSGTGGIYRSNGTAAFNFNGGTLRATGLGFTASIPMTLGTGTTSTVDSNGAGVTLSGALSGSGHLQKIRTGTLTLSGTNTYTGDLTVTAGAVAVSTGANLGAAGNTVTLDGGTLTAGAATTTIADRDISIGANGGTLDSGANQFNFSGSLQGTSALTKTGSGAVTLSGANPFSGTTNIAAGTLTYANTSAFYGDEVIPTNAAQVSVASGATLGVGIGHSGGFDVAEISTLSSHGNFAAGSSLGLDTTLADGGTATLTDANFGSLNFAKVGTGTLTLTGTTDHSGNTTVSAGTLTYANRNAFYGGTVNATTASQLTVANGTTAAFGVGDAGYFSASNLGTIATQTNFAAGSRFGVDTSNATAGTFTWDNAATGALHLVKQGTGTLALSGTATGTGNLSIDVGTLRFEGNAAAFPYASLNHTGTVDFAQTNEVTLTVNETGTGAFNISGGGTVTATGNLLSGTGDLTISHGTLNSPSNIRNFARAVTVTGADSTLAMGANGVRFGVSSGAGSLLVADGGTVTHSAASGSQFASFQIGFLSSSAGSVTVTGPGSTLTTASVIDINRSSAGGTLTITDGGVVNSTFNGTSSMSTGSGGSGVINLTGIGSQLNLNGQLTVGASGTATVNLDSGATLTADRLLLAQNASATGTLHLNAGGTLIVSDATDTALSAGNGSATFNFAGGTLRSNGTHGLTVSSHATLAAGTTSTFDTNGTAGTISGVLSGAGSLTKAGAGTLTLSGANTFTGGLFITGGTLALAAGGSVDAASGIHLGTTASPGILDLTAKSAGFTFGPAQTLTGSGAVNLAPGQALTVAGNLAPGNSPGLLTVNGDLAFTGTTVTTMELGGLARGTGYDAIDVTGSLSLGGSLQVTLSQGFTPALGNTFQLFSFSSIGGSFANIGLPVIAPGLSWDTSALATFGTLGVQAGAIPEPASIVALAGLAALGVGATRRRRSAQPVAAKSP